MTKKRGEQSELPYGEFMKTARDWADSAPLITLPSLGGGEDTNGESIPISAPVSGVQAALEVAMRHAPGSDRPTLPNLAAPEPAIGARRDQYMGDNRPLSDIVLHDLGLGREVSPAIPGARSNNLELPGKRGRPTNFATAAEIAAADIAGLSVDQRADVHGAIVEGRAIVDQVAELTRPPTPEPAIHPGISFYIDTHRAVLGSALGIGVEPLQLEQPILIQLIVPEIG